MKNATFLPDDPDLKRRMCPYLDIECQEVCPGWLAEMEDCLFHVCLTQVKETFVAAAVFLDGNLGLTPGTGLETLQGLREVINGDADDKQKQIVSSVLGGLLSSGVLTALSKLSIAEIAGKIRSLEHGITFSLGSLFGFGEDEAEEVEEAQFRETDP